MLGTGLGQIGGFPSVSRCLVLLDGYHVWVQATGLTFEVCSPFACEALPKASSDPGLAANEAFQ